MGKKDAAYIQGESYIDIVNELYNKLPLSYANDLKNKFSAYPIEWQFKALTAENNYIINNKPNITQKTIDKLDFNINRQNVASLITTGDAHYVLERLKENFGREILENPKVCEFNQQVLDILLNIEDFDAFDKLAALGLEVDLDSQERMVRKFAQYTYDLYQKRKEAFTKYIAPEDGVEFNFI